MIYCDFNKYSDIEKHCYIHDMSLIPIVATKIECAAPLGVI